MIAERAQMPVRRLEIRAVIARIDRLGGEPRGEAGQHFLHEQHVVHFIARQRPDLGAPVWDQAHEAFGREPLQGLAHRPA